MPSGVYKRTKQHRDRMGHGIALAWRTPSSRKRLLKAVRKNAIIATKTSASLPRTSKQLAATHRKRTRAEQRNLRKASSRGRMKIVVLRKKKNGVCWICRKRCFSYKDHCHKTGKRRGKLCLNCNLGLGLFKDNPKLLKKAIRYLKKWKKRHATQY
jgi:Recombination endonuclease VII